MSEIEAIKKYLEWAEERRIAGEPHSIEAYEEAMRVVERETRIRLVQDILFKGGDPSEMVEEIRAVMPSVWTEA